VLEHRHEFNAMSSTDVSEAAAFYRSARGAVAMRLLRERLGELWPDLSGRAVMGLGYAAPYLNLWRERAGRCVNVVPAQLGAAVWPRGAAGLSCTAEEDSLPFADLSFDNILLVHGLEHAENARRLLRELWRLLREDGRLLVVAPNRMGMWAHLEATPFGHGHPYSQGQITRLLNGALFTVERRDVALFVPPLRWRPLLRGARMWDQVGRVMMTDFGGLTITEARKDVLAGMPIEAVARRRVVFAEAA
jgi:SAM-dependent methyltransferase